MKEYVVLTISDDKIIFDYRQINEEEKDYVNKNDFYKNSLYYALKYFSHHYDKVYEILKKKKDVSSLVIKRLITFKYASILLIRNKINNLNLDFSSTLSLSDYELFLAVPNLKHIDCYYMPVFTEEKFKKKNVEVVCHNEYKVSDRFMLQEDAFDYETLYYMKNLKILEEYPNIIDDIKEFLRINYNLKSIHIYVFSKDLISSIIDLVKNDESRNIVVFLHQGHDKGNFIAENFAWLRELNKKCKVDYTCEFRIIYSNAFLGKNLFKQLTYNNLKLIFILFIYISLVSLIIVKSYEYVEKISIDKLNSDLSTDITDDIIGNNDTLSEDDGVVDEEISEEEIKTKYTFKNVLPKLIKTNNETVGYLVVKDTKISYPVVQHSDNSYYLKRDFYKKKRMMGWVFMDYRNSKTSFDDNTIIYGHSMLNGTMFGTLHNVLNSSWRKTEENMIITFDTKEGTYLFKIFAAYRVDYTTDYLKTTFDSKKSFKSQDKHFRK